MKKITIVWFLCIGFLIMSGCEAFRKQNPEDEEETKTETEAILESETTVTAEEEKKLSEKTSTESAESEKTEIQPSPKATKKTETKAPVSTEIKSEVKVETKKEPKLEPKKPEIKVFNLVAKQFDFTPSTITVNEGDTVKINVTSKDVPHGFVIPDFGVNKVINPNTTVSVEFIANKKGTFTFRCSVYCGEGHPGMSGTLVVK